MHFLSRGVMRAKNLARARNAQNFLRARAQNQTSPREIKDVNLQFYNRKEVIVCAKGIHDVNFDQIMRFNGELRVKNCKLNTYV